MCKGKEGWNYLNDSSGSDKWPSPHPLEPGPTPAVMSNTTALLQTVKNSWRIVRSVQTVSITVSIRILTAYGACISWLHQGTVCYGSYDLYYP